MNIIRPAWTLRAPPCPTCGLPELTFATCRGCGRVVLVCAEDGTLVPDPHVPTEPAAACPSCGAKDFGDISGPAIEALGFNLADLD